MYNTYLNSLSSTTLIPTKGGTTFETLVWPTGVIIIYKLSDAFTEHFNIVSRINVDVFLFDGTPKAFNPDIIFTSSFSIHTNFDREALEAFDPFLTCVLYTLIAINDVW